MKRKLFSASGLLMIMTALEASSVKAATTAHGTLWQDDFNGKSSWLTAPASGVGTVDVAGGKEGSGGLVLSVDAAASAGDWVRALKSGPLAIRNSESNLGKLTFSFMASVSTARPVKVRIESFDANKQRSGGLETTIYPAAADFYQRYALDLSSMKPVGGGAFQPTDPFVQFSYEIGSDSQWPANARQEVRIDNVNYARASVYVSPKGNDSNDGLTEQTPFATPQKAVNAAQPGDIILLMDGTYPGGKSQITFRRGGSPAAWITVKNYPGQTPTLENESWNCVLVGTGSKEKPSDAPAIGYIEVRGLHVVGNAAVAKTKYPEALDKPDPRTNGNGINIEGRYEKNTPHHFRFADNVVEYNCGGGINAMEADWVTIENNTVRNNCWWMIYAGSGISVLGASNFDATEGNYKALVRNNMVSGNQCYLKWKSLNRYSDGNGIIFDVNKHTASRPNGAYLGRSLITGNVSFNNGGSGIHDVQADHTDIVNNTTYMNSASPHLQYGQIDTYGGNDVRVINNIMVAPVANIAAGEKPEPVVKETKSKNMLYSHNISFGGNTSPTLGDDDAIADPMFVAPSIDAATADFHLKAGSPALKTGQPGPLVPLIDLDGKVLVPDAPVNIGAYTQ